MQNITKEGKARILMLMFVCLSFLLVAEVGIGYYLIRQASFSAISDKLQSFAARVRSDVKFENGVWDLSAYNADPLTPHPSGSGGFTYPLYIVTTEGFVIERTAPINGLLDTSDFQRLSQYDKLQTVTAPTEQEWRVLSRPLRKDGVTLGVVLVSYYLPEKYNLQEVDRRLTESMDHLVSQIGTSKNKLDTSRIDARNVYYDITSEVVDRHNKVLFVNGRVPTFVDESYVARELSQPSTRIVTDSITGEQFYTHNRVISDSAGNVMGIIVTAQSVANIYELLRYYVIFSLVFSIVLVVPLSIVGFYVIDREFLFLNKRKEQMRQNPSHIQFNGEKGILTVGEAEIHIPKQSYQYYLCDTLFSDTDRKWLLEEIASRIHHDESDSWKTIYDAHLAINRKAGIKLVSYDDRQYQINPRFASAIRKK